MPVELEARRSSGQGCKYGTAPGALTLEMTDKHFKWAVGCSSAAPSVQLSTRT